MSPMESPYLPPLIFSATLSPEPPTTPAASDAGMILEDHPHRSASSNPIRRSILKAPTFHFHILVPAPRLEVACRDDSIKPLPRSLTDKIPLELIYHCIDFLRQDKETLRNCVLVCKTWLSHVRPLLLPRKMSVVVQKHTGKEIFDILTAPGSRIIHFVHTLSIQANATFILQSRSPTPTADDLGVRETQTVSFNQYLLPFIGNSPSLKTLVFQGVQFLPKAPKEISAIPVQLKALPHITLLELTRCAFSTFNELLLVICAQRTLLELVIVDVTILVWLPDQHPPHNLRLPRRMHSLTLSTPGQTLILKWILSRPDIPRLKALSLGGANDTEDQHITALFLRALGPNLEHLNLSLVRATHLLDLSYNTRLQSLGISHYLIGTLARENVSPKSGLVQILRGITSTDLRTIDLAFVNAPQDLFLMPWVALAAELNDPKFSGLRLLRMRVTGKRAKWDGALRAIFPRLSVNQILKIIWDSSA